MKFRKALVAPLLAGALLLGACGGGGDDGDTGSEEEQGTALAAEDINAQDRGSLQQGGELRMAQEDLAVYWNPLSVNGNNADWTDVRNQILPSLYAYDAKGTAIPDPDYLLEATEVSKSPTTINFKLNPKAVWGDGSPIDADDMTAMWKACSGEDKKFECASTQGFDQIKSITAGADKFDVTVTFKASYPDWTQPWYPLVKAESIKDAETFNTGWKALNNDWLGGPFMYESYDKTQKVLTLVPNSKWWGEKPLLDKIVWREIAEDAQAAAFENNEIDAFEVGVNADSYQRAGGVADGALRKAAGPDFRHITFNSTAGLLKDLAIRQAIVRSLDREAIGASDLAGIDFAVRPLNNNILLESQEGYEDVAARTGINYDLEKAKADLDAAGWKAGSDGIRVKDGKPLAVKFMQLSGIAVSENEALQVQNQLKEVGIKIEIVDVPVDRFEDTLVGGEFELMPFSWIGTPYPFAGVSQIYGTGSDSNFARLSMPEVDANAKKMDTEPDVAARVKLANDTAAIIWENVHTLPLYQRPQIHATKAKLANYGSFGLGLPNWENVGYQS